MSGLIAPTAPEADRWETIWHYMQGGPASSRATCTTTHPTATSVNALQASIPVTAALFPDRRIRLFLHARRTRDLAGRIKGAHVTIMEGLGHFPVSEDPPRFLGYLRPVLEQILARDAQS